ncbi:MAG: hypothetical protein WAW39_25390 [Prosthecobacter sp.]|uniref:hypothetical protein n=1 Tax=Prosthecobacter sp. TaxID=1965333 RepID=UPI003BB11586
MSKKNITFKKAVIKGWVETNKPPQQVKTYTADSNGASADMLKSKAGVVMDKAIKATKALSSAPMGKTKLRGVFMRPQGGDDSQAKLVVVDDDNVAQFAQG